MFIALEGTDGCGKSTQGRLLINYLQAEGLKVSFYHFPVLVQGGVFGSLLASYLRGELGSMQSLPPKLIGALYAANRNDFQYTMRTELAAGNIIVADRYFASNLAYAGAKLTEPSEREELIRWLIRTDLVEFGNLEPDCTLFFDAPLSFSMQVNRERQLQNSTSERSYTAGKQDIHEAKWEYQQQVQNIYRTLGDYLNHYNTINCHTLGGSMRTIEEIFDDVKHTLKDVMKQSI
ncbi:MAG: dTMP kinase [Bacteroides sp.]